MKDHNLGHAQWRELFVNPMPAFFEPSVAFE
jgi:hypothetical protein